jgi:hypothetical protein
LSESIGRVYPFLGIETKGRSIEAIDQAVKHVPAVAE